MSSRLRNIYFRSNISDLSRPEYGGCAAANLSWFQAETIRLRLTMQTGTFPVPVEDDSKVKLEAWIAGDVSTLYISKLGSVVNVDGGVLGVDLTAGESNLPTGSYNYHIKVFSADDVEMGVAAAGILQVVSSPNSASAVYVGTTPSEGTWGNIVGTLSDQTDLQSALDAKAADSEVVKLTGDQTVAGIKTHSDEILIDYGDGNGKVRLRAGNFPSLQFKDNADAFYAQLTSDEDAHTLNFDYDGPGAGFLNFRRQIGTDDIVMSFEADGTIKPRKDIVPLLTNMRSLGSALVSWLAAHITTVFTTTAQAQTAGGLALKDSTGTTQATVDSTGLVLADSATDVGTRINAKADDADVVKLTGTQSIAGEKTFTDTNTYVNVLRTAGGSSVGINGSFAGYATIGGAGAATKGRFLVATNGVQLDAFQDGEGINIRPTIAGQSIMSDLVLADQGGDVLASNVNPHTDATYGLGTSLLKWLTAYISTLYTGVVQALTSAGGSLKSSNGTTCASWGAGAGANMTIASLALTTDLAVTHGGTGASTAQAALINLAETRVATLAGTDTLTTSSAAYQDLDPNGADRNVNLPATGRFVITNTGSAFDLDVYKSDATTLVDTIEPGVSLTFVSTGTDTWSVK